MDNQFVCGCGVVADLSQDPHAADGWTIAPVLKCDACTSGETVAQQDPE